MYYQYARRDGREIRSQVVELSLPRLRPAYMLRNLLTKQRVVDFVTLQHLLLYFTLTLLDSLHTNH